MDEEGAAFFKLLFYMMIAPFWLAWKIIGSLGPNRGPLIEAGHDGRAS